jgi:biopolymer transport protein ExbB/TolQ
MEGFLEIFNQAVDSGGLELILTATGMTAAIPGVLFYKKMRKAKKLKEQLNWASGGFQNRHLTEVSQIG